jgi:hypothetical protein
MEETQRILITSKLSLYIFRAVYLSMVIFISLFIAFSLRAFILDIFTNSKKIYVNPILSGGTVIGERIVTVLILTLLAILLNWLIRLLFRSRHFSIDDTGIHFNNEIVKWNEVSKITAFGGNGPIIVLRLNNNIKLKKIVGALPVFSAKDRVNKVASFAQVRGIKIRRWFI